MTAMYQLTRLVGGRHRERLVYAGAHRPAERLLAVARATHRAECAESRC
jgi:hypothetical protein